MLSGKFTTLVTILAFMCLSSATALSNPMGTYESKEKQFLTQWDEIDKKSVSWKDKECMKWTEVAKQFPERAKEINNEILPPILDLGDKAEQGLITEEERNQRRDLLRMAFLLQLQCRQDDSIVSSNTSSTRHTSPTANHVKENNLTTDDLKKRYEKEWEEDSFINSVNYSFFGGVNISQTGNPKISLTEEPELGNITLNTKSDLGQIGGIKLGYTFKSINGHRDFFELKPALEIEGFYNGFDYTGTNSFTEADVYNVTGITVDAGTYNGRLRTRVDSATFSINPLLKMKLGSFQPYFGGGIGGTYISIGDVRLSATEPNGVASGITLEDRSINNWAFTVQGIFGVDCLITEQFGFFTEYKYINLMNVRLKGDLLTGEFDSLSQNVIIAGFRINL